MSTSDPKNYRVNLTELLAEAQISIRESTDTQGGLLHELEPSHCGGRRALVFDRKEKGITVAVRVEIPEASPLRNLSTTSPEVLQLLGALTQSLQGRDAEARLISDDRGVDAIMVSNRLCERSIDAAMLSKHLNQVQDVIKEIEPALSLSGQTLIENIIERVRPVIAEVTKDVSREAAVVVPTFDERARDLMTGQTQQ
jgi:hypothetical protein